MTTAQAPLAPLQTSRKQQAIDAILASKHFIKAPLLSAFLTYVCRRALENGATRISEQEIGIKVFHRAEGYDSAEDNIVRNYARQLRKRLYEYYVGEGCDEEVRIEIPKGGYVPLFVEKRSVPHHRAEISLSSEQHTPQKVVSATLDRTSSKYLKIVFIVLLLSTLGFLLVQHFRKPVSSKLHPLWAQLFTPAMDTFLVPADTTFTLLEEMSGRRFSLEAYKRWLSSQTSESDFNAFLRRRKDTSVMDMQIASSLQHLPEVLPERLLIRSSQNLTMDDLKSSNAIFIGSIDSIPWIEAFQNRLNFRFIYNISEKQGVIENVKPQPGESSSYESSLDKFAQKTYAVLAFIPNLERTGQILLIQGLDASGTEAAADLLLQTDGMDEVLNKAMRPDGSLGEFEVLLETTVLDSHPTNIHIIAIRTKH